MDLTNLAVQALMGMTVTIGFGMLFNVPRETLFPCALVGVIGHVFRVVLRGIGISNEVATFFASLTVGLIGYGMAKRMDRPRLVFTVTGIISMIPGIPSYETIIFFSRSDILSGIQSAVKAGMIATSVAVGLSTARILTEVEIKF
jgi:uncharacterized membrane protein YjjB (DUF3815 family)